MPRNRRIILVSKELYDRMKVVRRNLVVREGLPPLRLEQLVERMVIQMEQQLASEPKAEEHK